MVMRNTIIILSALLLAACSERYYPNPIDGGGGAGGEAPAHVKAAPSSEPDACPPSAAKCQGRWH